MRPWVAYVVVVGCTGTEEEPIPADQASTSGYGLVINEVAAEGSPDWFEVVNTGAPVDLSTLMFVDRRGDFVRAHRFPEVTLGSGARHVQDVTRADAGFALGKSDGLWIYTFDERVLVDGVSWSAGGSPRGGCLARVPDMTGGFVALPCTRGWVNDP